MSIKKTGNFQFKKFNIEQDKCAMKVGTDGVLLGAWCSTIEEGKILDIGTGSGLIALMLAQRCTAEIIGIEIDSAAAEQAKINVAKTEWNTRIRIENIALQDFLKQNSLKFDGLVTNPPFFIQSLKGSNPARAIARHNDLLSFEQIIFAACQILSCQGFLSLILPIEESKIFQQIARANGFHLYRKTYIKPNLQKAAKRVLLEFSQTMNNIYIENTLTIETNARHEYSTEYKQLTKDFYLAF